MAQILKRGSGQHTIQGQLQWSNFQEICEVTDPQIRNTSFKMLQSSTSNILRKEEGSTDSLQPRHIFFLPWLLRCTFYLQYSTGPLAWSRCWWSGEGQWLQRLSNKRYNSSSVLSKMSFFPNYCEQLLKGNRQIE